MNADIKILIAGLGNDLLTDDGVGVKIVNELNSIHFGKNVVYKSSYFGGWELLDLIEGYDLVLFIDAVIEKDRKTGSTGFHSLDSFKETLHLSHFHDSDFLTTISFGKMISMKIPEHIFIYSIQIEEDKTFNRELSALLAQRYEDIILEVKNVIIKLQSGIYDYEKIGI